MKPFDIELAKKNHPVQTRDGRPARIICYDRKNIMFPIIALIKYDDREDTQYFDNDGKCWQGANGELNLVMASTKKEGWINIYHSSMYIAGASNVYKTEEVALKGKDEKGYITTIKIEWEE